MTATTAATAGGTRPARPAAVTLYDVAARAGVHYATASRALQPSTRHLVNDETAVRVLDAAAALGYRPNNAAASLRTRRTRTAGLLVPDLTDPLIPPLVRGAEDVLTAAGYMVMLASTDNDTSRESHLLNQMRCCRVDGLILAGNTARPGLVTSAAQSRLPGVVAGHAPHDRALPSAAADTAHAAKLIMGLVAARGHRAIACITAPGAPIGQEELLTAARARGLQTPACLTVPARELTVEAGRKRTQYLLTTGVRFTAVVTSSDVLAAGSCQALAEASRPCPASISVTGAGDIPLAASLFPALTTVRLPQYAVGAAAARLLLEQLSEPAAAPAPVRLPAELITRGSVAPAPPAR
jgi:LacI family transcriptional regulator